MTDFEQTEGSVQEVQSEWIKNSRDLIVIQYSRKRKYFKKPIQHSTIDSTDAYRFFPSFKDPKFNLERIEHHVGVQFAVSKVDRCIQTPWFRKVNNSTQCTLEDTLNENIVETPDISSFVQKVEPAIQDAIMQNTTFQVFKDDFEELQMDLHVGRKSESQLKEHQSFTHIEYTKNKKISSIHWHPKSRNIIAFTCIARNGLEERLQYIGKSNTSYVILWNFSDPIYPQSVLEAPYDVTCIQFHPNLPNLIVGGLSNGQVILWDIDDVQKSVETEETKTDSIPVIKWKQLSLIEGSHHIAVNHIQWLPFVVGLDGKITKDGDTQFATIAADGRWIIWDIRKDYLRFPKKQSSEKLRDAWLPFMVHYLNKTTEVGEITGQQFVLGKEYKIHVCTQEGEFVIADWSPRDGNSSQQMAMQIPATPSKQGSDQTEKRQTVNIVRQIFGKNQGAHIGHVNTIQRHPIFEDVFLTIGEFSFKFWKPPCQRPIYSSPWSDVPYMCGSWSPTRPSVIYLCRADGNIEIWDFMDKSHELSLVNNISSSALTSMEFRVGSGASKHSVQYLAVGTDIGTLHIIEIPKNLIKPLQGEEESMLEFLKREQHRVEYYAKRWEFHKDNAQKLRQEGPFIEEKKEEQEEIDYVALKEKFLKMITETQIEM